MTIGDRMATIQCAINILTTLTCDPKANNTFAGTPEGTVLNEIRVLTGHMLDVMAAYGEACDKEWDSRSGLIDYNSEEQAIITNVAEQS